VKTTPLPLSVLIVEDHDITLAGITLVLSRFPEFSIADTLSRGSLVADTVRKGDVDLILLDFELPDMNGSDLLAELVGRFDMRIVILTGTQDARAFDFAKRMGALGLVSKADPSEHIVSALRAAAYSKFYLSPLVEEKLGLLDCPQIILTHRQNAILHFLNSGYSNKEIGYRLGIAPPTVSFHIAELRRKLGADHTRNILARAKALGLN